jgi:protein SCO1
MDDENNYVTHIGSNMNEHDMATLIVEKVLENERNKIRHY